ncbi:uncharacterized protein LOC125197236 isoform X2 [Salvia hispanica]|uniref:uncharacterized protein LOC125197236 isoform X2 n=1 Tax=Salvia hispanica TaxID=49212 RepID=UPI002009A49B|nr:uncharacterized protein LOC125197236 isoform X2 [Salvia hispanica]
MMLTSEDEIQHLGGRPRRLDGRYGWAPEPRSGGSGSSPPTPTPTPPTRGTRTPYTPDEMMQMFKAYLAVSEDPDVGTNQIGETYWWRITRLHNETRPGGTIYRNDSMVHNCIFRANEAIGKFQGYYQQEERAAGSGKSELDIISAALATYQSLELKPFKYLSCWQEGRQHPKYKGGIVVPSSSSSSKRSRSVALSDGVSDDVATQLAGTNLGSPDAGPSISHRPQGRRRRPTAVAGRLHPPPLPLSLPLCHLNPRPTRCGPS